MFKLVIKDGYKWDTVFMGYQGSTEGYDHMVAFPAISENRVRLEQRRAWLKKRYPNAMYRIIEID